MEMLVEQCKSETW